MNRALDLDLVRAAAGLTRGLGMSRWAAFALATRWHGRPGPDEDELRAVAVLVEGRPAAWLAGSLDRPTARPVRAPHPKITAQNLPSEGERGGRRGPRFLGGAP
jgi:hypothetical protein